MKDISEAAIICATSKAHHAVSGGVEIAARKEAKGSPYEDT
jgi:hypothetical protein